jgi:hypothetical protein
MNLYFFFQKLPYPKSVFFIISNEFCERFSYYGMRSESTTFYKVYFFKIWKRFFFFLKELNDLNWSRVFRKRRWSLINTRLFIYLIIKVRYKIFYLYELSKEAIVPKGCRVFSSPVSTTVVFFSCSLFSRFIAERKKAFSKIKFRSSDVCCQTMHNRGVSVTMLSVISDLPRDIYNFIWGL